MKCGSEEKLEFDHIDPFSKDWVTASSQMIGWCQERLDAELAKCQILCRPCHVEKTRVDMRTIIKPLVHGTASGYRYRGCRCDLCRVAHNARCRKTYSNRKNRS